MNAANSFPLLFLGSLHGGGIFFSESCCVLIMIISWKGKGSGGGGAEIEIRSKPVLETVWLLWSFIVRAKQVLILLNIAGVLILCPSQWRLGISEPKFVFSSTVRSELNELWIRNYTCRNVTTLSGCGNKFPERFNGSIFNCLVPVYTS